jgi:hypothetical protein
MAFLQALVGASDLDENQRMAPLRRRAAQFQGMLDRARDRGEPVLDYTVVVERALASAGPPMSSDVDKCLCSNGIGT